MNIFYLHKNPVICASYHCDKHVVKMILEYTQLLIIPYHQKFNSNPNKWAKQYQFNFPNSIPKITHENHPCAIWARESWDNWIWLVALAYNLCIEYQRRYNKQHSYQTAIFQMWHNSPLWLPKNGITKRPQCFGPHEPECYIKGRPLEAYRRYYIIAKEHIAYWKHGKTPKWYKPI